MTKYIHHFTNVKDYNTMRNGSDYIEPWTSLTDGRGLDYNKEHDYYRDYLTFEIVQAGTWGIICSGSDNLKTISYRLNRESWQEMTSSTSGTTIDVSLGDEIEVKGANNQYSDSSQYNYFYGSSHYNVKGNIMSLLYGDDFIGNNIIPVSNAFEYLFKSTNITDASDLILPATTLKTKCYMNMFNGSTLVNSPLYLPAMTLTNYCYNNMFNDCINLTSTPELPAVTMKSYCYGSMFRGCTSLTTAPELPATTLAGYCYWYMFNGCTSLTTAPELPATTLENYCYTYMFQGCTSLTETPMLSSTTLANYCYSCMFDGCTNLTTVQATLPATSLRESCYSAMFKGCSKLTTAPTLPATTLATKCYASMFRGCSNLTTAPILPATTLVERCYERLFDSCAKLKYIKCLATDISASMCTYYWVTGIAASGTFEKNSSMSSWTTGISGIPSGWTQQNAS